MGTTQAAVMSSPLLEVVSVSKAFGGIKAVSDLSLTIDEGELVGLIGPNGSGKTTLLHCLTGALVPDAGVVRFGGQDVTGMPPFRIARAGIARSFQNLEDFPNLPVRDHLLLAKQWRKSPIDRTLDDPDAQQVLEDLSLAHMADRLAGELSYGQRKLLGIGMAIVQRSRLLLLDEPTAGVNPTLADSIAERLGALAATGQSIILVEHNVPLVIRLATRLIVMSAGSVIADGKPREVRDDPRVREAYFGR